MYYTCHFPVVNNQSLLLVCSLSEICNMNTSIYINIYNKVNEVTECLKIIRIISFKSRTYTILFCSGIIGQLLAIFTYPSKSRKKILVRATEIMIYRIL